MLKWFNNFGEIVVGDKNLFYPLVKYTVIWYLHVVFALFLAFNKETLPLQPPDMNSKVKSANDRVIKNERTGNTYILWESNFAEAQLVSINS